MKRTKRKNVIFTAEQWESVCRRAEFLEMKPATFIRNMALHEKWIVLDAEDCCGQIRKLNHIGNDMNMVIRVAENTKSKYLEKLQFLRKRYEDYRAVFYRHYSPLSYE